MAETLKKSVSAGLMIGIGSVLYISCENKVVGALLFSVGLFAVCAFGMYLFTGKIGYVFSNKNNPNCLLIWLGNFLGASAGMALVRFAKPALHEPARQMMEAKLEQNYLGLPVLPFFCGLLMYIAVENYRENPHGFGKGAILFLCVSGFILCGFEHSIADICYAALAVETFGDFLRYLLFIIVVSVFNGLGSLAVRWLNTEKKK